VIDDIFQSAIINVAPLEMNQDITPHWLTWAPSFLASALTVIITAFLAHITQKYQIDTNRILKISEKQFLLDQKPYLIPEIEIFRELNPKITNMSRYPVYIKTVELYWNNKNAFTEFYPVDVSKIRSQLSRDVFELALKRVLFPGEFAHLFQFQGGSYPLPDSDGIFNIKYTFLNEDEDDKSTKFKIIYSDRSQMHFKIKK
jgi:hypothetical protein